MEKVESRVNDIVSRTIIDIDAKNRVYQFEITNENLKEAVLKVFADIKSKFPTIKFSSIPKLSLLQIVTQIRMQYDKDSLPLIIKLDLGGLFKEPEQKEIIVQNIEPKSEDGE